VFAFKCKALPLGVITERKITPERIRDLEVDNFITTYQYLSSLCSNIDLLLEQSLTSLSVGDIKTLLEMQKQAMTHILNIKKSVLDEKSDEKADFIANQNVQKAKFFYLVNLKTFHLLRGTEFKKFQNRFRIGKIKQTSDDMKGQCDKDKSWVTVVKFDPPYNATDSKPQIAYGFKGFNADRGFNARIKTEISDISNSGFTLKTISWSDSITTLVEYSYIAFV